MWDGADISCHYNREKLGLLALVVPVKGFHRQISVDSPRKHYAIVRSWLPWQHLWMSTALYLLSSRTSMG